MIGFRNGSRALALAASVALFACSDANTTGGSAGDVFTDGAVVEDILDGGDNANLDTSGDTVGPDVPNGGDASTDTVGTDIAPEIVDPGSFAYLVVEPEAMVEIEGTAILPE
mgnify:CR=1 FL=1